ncbi:class I SAM-dependent methyltransferase [Brevundimonas sp.]|uniref:class I SAM-dependent methyltransferase n=1 Tax=Brevundimonas sp. TaxID=1871086 RepID=UPI003BA997A0
MTKTHRLAAAAVAALMSSACSGAYAQPPGPPELTAVPPVSDCDGAKTRNFTAAEAAADADAAAAVAAGTYSGWAAAVADPRRLPEETVRDPLRHPAEMLAFMRLTPGDTIADIRPEEGYFTRLFAPTVGEHGRVYAFVPNQTAERENAFADTLAATYPNTTRVTGDLDTLSFECPLDVVFMGQEYHDFVIPRFGVDVAKMNAAVFAALKPGGLYVILDHQAAPGAGTDVVGTLHRIEASALRAQVEAAGFVFDGETDVVANPDDDHSLSVFDPAIRGKSDQFVYRFRKPD